MRLELFICRGWQAVDINYSKIHQSPKYASNRFPTETGATFKRRPKHAGN